MAARRWRVMVAVGVVLTPLAFVGTTPSPAGAVITPPGVCTGRGTFERGTKARGPFTEESSALAPNTVVKVPIKDKVHWQGTVKGPSGRRAISGFVAVRLPAPFGHVTIDTWGKTTTRVQNSGVHAYSVPSLTPRGVIFPVYGAHFENGQFFCGGYVDVTLEGSAFDEPWTYAALVLTFGALVGLILAGRPVFRKISAESDAP
jgi:hypothetical protein